MLPSRLLDVDVRDGRVVPRWLGPHDEPWLGEMLAAWSTLAGRPASAEDDVWKRILFGIMRRWDVPARTMSLACALERKRWSSRIVAAVPPEKARDVTFELAATRSRREALHAAAEALGVSADDVERSLFADRAEARILEPPEEDATPPDAVDRQNLALAIGLLERAVEIVARVRVDPQPLAWRAKREGLIATFADDDGATRVMLSGPLALFRDTTKYGGALARFVPHLVAERGWGLRARVVIADAPALFELDDTAALTRRAPPPARPRGPGARLVRDLEKRAGAWHASQALDAVHTPAGIFFPDLELVREGARVLVEILTYATGEHVTRVRAALDAAELPVILCVDRRGLRDALAPPAGVLLYDGVIDAGELVAAAERAVGPLRRVS